MTKGTFENAYKVIEIDHRRLHQTIPIWLPELKQLHDEEVAELTRLKEKNERLYNNLVKNTEDN